MIIFDLGVDIRGKIISNLGQWLLNSNFYHLGYKSFCTQIPIEDREPGQKNQ